MQPNEKSDVMMDKSKYFHDFVKLGDVNVIRPSAEGTAFLNFIECLCFFLCFFISLFIYLFLYFSRSNTECTLLMYL